MIAIPIGRKRRIVISLQHQHGWNIYAAGMDRPNWCLHDSDAQSVERRLQETGRYSRTDKAWKTTR